MPPRHGDEQQLSGLDLSLDNSDVGKLRVKIIIDTFEIYL
jgi:hypothetical protein